MKAVIQRASKAQVEVDKQIAGKIDKGLVILLCVEQGDGEADCDFIARKCCELRIFEDADGKMNLSLLDVGGAILLISQFTLAAEWKKGRRPGFTKAAHPSEGQRLYEYFAGVLQKMNVQVERGVFGAHMEVSLCNDGPVTLILDYQVTAAGTTTVQQAAKD
jgi:D-aminoacyl-tRNA deacylase